MQVERDSEQMCWKVTGEGVNVRVFGSIKYGPNGAIQGRGAKNFRNEILAAVEQFMKPREDNDGR